MNQYTFGLFTLNLTDHARSGKNPFTGADINFHIDAPLSEEQTVAVTAILDRLGATTPDRDGYRYLALSNKTRVGVGGFIGNRPRSLPMEFSVKNRFSTPEASMVLRLVQAGNLFAGSLSDPDIVAIIRPISDVRFYERHRAVTVAADEISLVLWVRTHIKSRAVRHP